MFGPTASPVVHCQSTWHIGPTTCVLTPRSRARFDSDASSDDVEPLLHRRQLGLHPARERDRVGRVAADEARRARDAVVQDVGADRARRRGRRASSTRSARPRCARAGRARSRSRVRVSTTRAVVAELVRAELDLERHGGDRDHRDADERLRRRRERLQVDARDEAVGRRPSPRGAPRSRRRRSSGASA